MGIDMTERERLIELLDDYTEGLSARDLHKADFAKKFADYLLANGVIVPLQRNALDAKA